MKKSLLFLIAILFFSGLFLSQAKASIFKYTDREGSDHYTDSLESVPLKYRTSAVNLDEHLEKNSGFIQEPPRPEEPLPDRLKDRTMNFITFWKKAVKTAWKRTWMRTVLIMVTFFTLFIFAGKVAKALGNKNLSSVIRISLTTIIMVYLLHSYVTQIALDFMEMKRNVLQVKEKADQRNMEMDRLIKSIVGKENVKNTSQK